MADRDLHGQSEALYSVLGGLQREMRLLKSRAARPGAVRHDGGPGEVLTSVINQTLTLNELHLDPGQWVLLASGEVNIDSSVFNGGEVVAAVIRVIEPNGAVVDLTRASYSPMSAPLGLASGPVWATSWAVFAVHQSLEPFTVLHQGLSGAYTGGIDTLSWYGPTLMALPM